MLPLSRELAIECGTLRVREDVVLGVLESGDGGGGGSSSHNRTFLDHIEEINLITQGRMRGGKRKSKKKKKKKTTEKAKSLSVS